MREQTTLVNSTLRQQGFLPSFDANHVVFLVVLIAEIFAIILALASTASFGDFWTKLGLISVFVMWIALGIVALLRHLGPWLNRLGTAQTALATFGLTQLVTLVCSLAIIWLGNHYALALLPDNKDFLNFTIRTLAISSIACLVALRYFYVQHQWKQNMEAEARARLQALQARIRPHFLFNSMNTIASLIHQHPDEAEDAIIDLADLFRSSLQQKDRISLREELEVAQRYLRIEQLRLGERLQVVWSLDDNLPLDNLIPALILQPLIENAIYHGIQPLPEGGLVTITLMVKHKFIEFKISNPLPPTKLASRQKGNQIAQDNIRQRLSLAYGEKSQVILQQQAQEYCVSFTIPLAAS